MPEHDALKSTTVQGTLRVAPTPTGPKPDLVNRLDYSQPLEICVFCKQIKLADDRWDSQNFHLAKPTNPSYRNSICPPCSMQRYPKLYDSE